MQSVLTALKGSKQSITKEEVMEQMNDRLQKEIEYYKNYINNVDIDPIYEMREYIKHGKYNVAIADLILPIISETLKIRIIILHANIKEQTYKLLNKNHIITPQKFDQTIYIEKGVNIITH